MATTAVGICCAALLKLGATSISGFADPTAEAEIAGTLYPIVRDAMLTARPWSFTLAQVLLDTPTSPPSAEYANAFALPADTLRVVSAGAGKSARGLEYAVQGTTLLADVSPVTVTYQRRAAEEIYPAFFVSALVARLAAEFCLPLTENGTRAEGLHALAAAELRLARLLDSQQATPRRVEDFTLVSVRQS